MKVDIKYPTQLEKKINSMVNTKTLIVGFLNSKEAEVARKMEFGGLHLVDENYKTRAKAKGIHLADYISIPPRPFMHDSVVTNKTEWKKKFNFLLKKTNDVDRSLRILGEIIKTDIQKRIDNANSFYQLNSLPTIIIKEKETVLRDTGEMRNSVNYDVINGKL